MSVREAAPALLALALAAGWSPQGSGQWFREVGAASGLDHRGPSYGGGAWSDFDRDGDPDLYVSGHFQRAAKLYENLGGGRFTEVSNQRFKHPSIDRFGDFHGPAWCDFDHDGDRDLIVTHGAANGIGTGANRFFVNQNGTFSDFASALDIDFGLGRSRTPLWLPYNLFDAQGQHDRSIDLLITAQERADGLAPTSLFVGVQPDPRFHDITQFLDLPTTSYDAALMSDLNGDGRLDLVLGGQDRLRVFETNTAPIAELTNALNIDYRRRAQDLASGDFDGNGLMDLFVAQRDRRSGLQVFSETRIEAALRGRNTQQGVSFGLTSSPGTASIDLASLQFRPRDIYIGSAGRNPSFMSFTMDWSDPSHYGLRTFTEGIDHGVFVGIDPTSSRLEIRASSGPYFDVAVSARSRQRIAHADGIQFDPNEPPKRDAFLMAFDDGVGGVRFEDHIVRSGVRPHSNTGGVARGDFDNDGDLDLFTLTHPDVTNRFLRHHLWVNRGNGRFTEAPSGGGIEPDPRGRADGISVVDYDRDGWLDLFITNGDSSHPFADTGRSQLFRNSRQRPGFHWLLVELEGTTSNRDGIGARVEVTVANHSVIREMDGGIHRSTQDDMSVLHFGLGGNSTVNQIDVLWPSGKRQTVRWVSADQVIKLIEP